MSSARSWSILFGVIGCAALLARLLGQTPQSTSQDPPPLIQRPPGFACSFRGPLVHIPSRTAGVEGLLVRISAPSKPRYAKGAPIAVHMLASRPNVTGSGACLSDEGFIDVGFLCPGGQFQAPDGTVWKSGGVGPADQVHWENCVEALADVLAFATGNVRSLEGKSIHEYSAVTALADNAGVVGWSFGGNLAVLAMARHGERFRGLKWYASWESPIRSPVDDGRGTMYQTNRFYHPENDTIEFDRLRYSPEMPIWAWPILGLLPQLTWPRGGLYLDGDGDDTFTRDADFAFWVDVELGPPMKVFYSPMVASEARARKVFGARWPSHIATVDELEARERRVNAVRHIPVAVRKLPGLAVLVFESDQHHVQGFGGSLHLDAIAQVNAWIDAKARWVRFNPDVHYLEKAMGKKPPREVQYPAMKKVERSAIVNLLEPAVSNVGPAVTASACELADRTEFRNWAPVLPGVLNGR